MNNRQLEWINWLILLTAILVNAFCLWWAEHEAWWVMLIAAWGFAMVNMLPFSIMHEAVHGIGASNKKRNRLMGVISGMVFGTSFSIQTAAHLGHHRRNRTDAEMYDYYLPSESKAMRQSWLYLGNLFGLYWFFIPIGNAIYWLTPWAFRSRYFVEKITPKIGFGPYVEDLVKLPIWQTWLEVSLMFAYQIILIWVLNLSWQTWLLCHWLFALHWSALQYVDHAWSARDVVNGAWNLKVSAPARWLALNYHFHLAHHQHPQANWMELPQLVDQKTFNPSFWQIYRSLWKGVRPAPPMGAPADIAIFEKVRTKSS